MTLWTIGHSTLEWGAFLGLLQGNGIEALADVRRFPASRRHPHFNAAHLRGALDDAGIAYAPFPDLGGRRRPRPGSANTAWRNASFRGYADYMETAEFQGALARLLELAAGKRTAIMCAEAVWWSCHRALIADELKARGVEVLHIAGPGAPKPHPYTSAARLVNGKLSYSAEQARLL